MHIVKIQYIGQGYLKMNIAWVNRHSPNILIPDRVKLWTKDVPNWTDITHKDVYESPQGPT